MGLTVTIVLIASILFAVILTVLDIIKTANKQKLDDELQAKQRKLITGGGSSIHYPSSTLVHLTGGGPALQRSVPVNPSAAYLGESHPSRSYIDETSSESVNSAGYDSEDSIIDDVVMTGLDILAGSYTPDDQTTQLLPDQTTYSETSQPQEQVYESPSYSEPQQDSSYSAPDYSLDSSSSSDSSDTSSSND